MKTNNLNTKTNNPSILKLRLSKFAYEIGTNKRQFTKSIEVSESFLTSDGGITEEKILKIISVFPQLNPNWLLTGNGSMLLSNSDNIIENKSNLDKQNEKEQRLLSHKDIEQLLTKQKDEIMSELTDVVKDLTNVMLGQTGVMKDQIKLNGSSIVASFEFMKEQLATLQKAIDKVDNKADKVQDSVFKIERKIG